MAQGALVWQSLSTFVVSTISIWFPLHRNTQWLSRTNMKLLCVRYGSIRSPNKNPQSLTELKLSKSYDRSWATVKEKVWLLLLTLTEKKRNLLRQKRNWPPGENFNIPHTSRVGNCARFLKPCITSSKQINPEIWETATCLPSPDHAKDEMSIFLRIRSISEPFSKLHKTRHLEFTIQLVRILVLSPEIEQAENLHLLPGKSGFNSPSMV